MNRIKQKFLAGSWLVWTALQFLFLLQYDTPVRVAWMDASVTATVLVAAGYVMLTLVKYFKPSFKNIAIVLAAAAALAFLSGGLSRSILKLLPGDATYSAWLDATLVVRLAFIWLMVVLVGVNGWLFYVLDEQQQGERRQQETDRLKREAELASLRQQFQPHFIFNSLNSISALAGSDPARARRMIEQLSDFLRGTITKETSQWVSLRDELRHLQLYLDIEKVRFGHRLQTTITADDATLDLRLPAMLLQPVMENAIKFGLYDTLGEVNISVTAIVVDRKLQIEIQNPFDPESATPRVGTGFGLRSIQKRLALLFYRSDLLVTSQNGNAFITQISIPQSERQQV